MNSKFILNVHVHPLTTVVRVFFMKHLKYFFNNRKNNKFCFCLFKITIMRGIICTSVCSLRKTK